jgi:hypothetical protein
VDDFFGMVQISSVGFLPLSIWTRYFRLGQIGDDDYREPMRLEEGEVPADLLVRLPEKVTTISTTHKKESAYPIRSANGVPTLGSARLVVATLYKQLDSEA